MSGVVYTLSAQHHRYQGRKNQEFAEASSEVSFNRSQRRNRDTRPSLNKMTVRSCRILLDDLNLDVLGQVGCWLKHTADLQQVAEK